MSGVIYDITSSPAQQYLRQVQNRRKTWIGFNKYKKLIYDVVYCDGQLQLVAQSIFGGDTLTVNQISRRGFCFAFKGVISDETILVVPDGTFYFYLFSLVNGTIEKCEMKSNK